MSYKAAIEDETSSSKTQAMYNLAKFLQQQKRMQEAGGYYETAEAAIRATRDAYASRLVAEKGISRAQAEDQAIATTASQHPEWSSVLNNFGMLLGIWHKEHWGQWFIKGRPQGRRCLKGHTHIQATRNN